MSDLEGAQGGLIALVPAAGIGSRVGGPVPKQYCDLLGKPLLVQTLERLSSCDAVGQVVVATANVDPHFDALSLTGVRRVTGGATRAHSVLALLESLDDHRDGEWALVHDAARPCVRHEDIIKLVNTVASHHHQGGILATRVRETVKQTDLQHRILATVPRTDLWLAGTPQLFRVGQLRDALRAALSAGVNVTDEASAMEWAGHSVCVVEGHDDNIKVTRPGDIEMAATILESQTQR